MSVILFQESAENGRFLINGVLTDIGEKLSRHQREVFDAPTQKMLREVVEKGGRVPAIIERKLITDLCEKHCENSIDNISGFVKRVAAELNVTLVGQANDIVDEIQKSL